jgi:hypothetical protein
MLMSTLCVVDVDGWREGTRVPFCSAPVPRQYQVKSCKTVFVSSSAQEMRLVRHADVSKSHQLEKVGKRYAL